MANYLNMAQQHQIEALLRLGWGHRRIAREVGVNRETVGRYARLLDGRGVMLGPPAENQPNPITGPPSAAARYQEIIEGALGKG